MFSVVVLLLPVLGEQNVTKLHMLSCVVKIEELTRNKKLKQFCTDWKLRNGKCVLVLVTAVSGVQYFDNRYKMYATKSMLKLLLRTKLISEDFITSIMKFKR